MPDQNNKLVKKILLSYVTTFMVIYLTDSLTMIADGMVVSRGLGPAALAAIGLADPTYKIASLFSGVLAVGLRALCANAMGSGDKERVNRIFSSGMVLTAAASLFVLILGQSFKGSLCILFGAGDDPVLSAHLYDYLKGWFAGIPGYIFFYVLSPLVSLDGNKRCVTVATAVQSGINILGDIAAVQIFHTGSYGVGLATGMAYNLSACVLILNFFRKRSVFQPFSARPDFEVLPRTLRIGMPVITQQICRILAPLLVNRTILSIGGSSAMAAISVKASIMGFCFIIGNGIAESVGLMTQILYSEKDAVSLKFTVKEALKLLVMLDLALAVLVFVFAGGISGIFLTKSTEAWLLARSAVRCLAISLPLNSCNSILVQYLQAARKMFSVHLITFFQRLAVLAVFTLLLGKTFGTVGLFAAIPVSEGTVLLGYLLVILLKRGRSDFWNSLLMIPDGFGYNRENSFSASISTLEEAVAVAERIEEFCGQHHVDRRKGYYSARCMEELAANVIERAFTADGKEHHCDIRVMIDQECGEVLLRLRDDCPYYNIRERYDALAEDDIDAGVWIRLVFALAREVNYINIFNTNTLIIRM